MVDGYYNTFVDAVARNRGTSRSAVLADYGQGRVLRSKQAHEVGMIDRIGSLEQVVRDLRPKNKSKSRAQNELELAKRRAGRR